MATAPDVTMLVDEVTRRHYTRDRDKLVEYVEERGSQHSLPPTFDELTDYQRYEIKNAIMPLVVDVIDVLREQGVI